MALKWGIVSAGLISHDFVNAVGTLSPDDHEIVAVAARDLTRAKRFAKRFNIPKAYNNYLELAKDPNVEVVYIGALNPQHLEIGLMMLENGKHVLCEKPLCMNEKQARQLITFAEQKNLFLMEAIWSRLFPAYQYVQKQISEGKLGEIQSVEAKFGFSGWGEVERVEKKDLGGGTILDLGVHTIQICQWAFQKDPKAIKATGILNDYGVDAEMSAALDYGDNKMGIIKTSGLKTQNNTAKIVGTKGTITIPSFWCPTSLIDVDGSEHSWPLPKAKHRFNYPNSCGLRYEAEETRKCIRAGKIESEYISHKDSITIAHIQDEIRKQIGIKYPEDE